MTFASGDMWGTPKMCALYHRKLACKQENPKYKTKVWPIDEQLVDDITNLTEGMFALENDGSLCFLDERDLLMFLLGRKK